MLLADHALYRLEADLRWIDHTAARLDLLGTSGAAMTVSALEARDFTCRSALPRRCGARRSPYRPGEIVAVIDRQGFGNSTLLHCLAGILVPDEGEVS